MGGCTLCMNYFFMQRLRAHPFAVFANIICVLCVK